MSFSETFKFHHPIIAPLSAFILGGFSALAMAPLNLWPVLFLTLSGFYLLLHFSTAVLRAALIGFFFGCGYFGFGLYWVGNALLVDGNPYRWAWPLAVSGLPIILSFFPAFGAALSKRIAKFDHALGFFAFVILFTISEWLRGHAFTGFPWNLFGYTWSDTLTIAQIASLGDIYLLTLITIFWACTPGFLLLATASIFQKTFIFVCSVALVIGSYGYGSTRLAQFKMQERREFDFILVQPNIPQHEKWDPNIISQNFMNTLRDSANADLNAPSSESKVTYIIWPETALASGFLAAPWAMNAIADMLKTYPHPAYLITGAQRYQPEGDRYYNSILVIDNKGQVISSYDKFHLVPFGEYMPLSHIFDIAPIVGFKGFEKGTGPTAITTPEDLRFSPLICYEIIFSGKAISKTLPKPELILNVTNDAWYGISPGPYQHLIQAQFRAIENDIPVIRVANTGFTALIDPVGQIIFQSNLFEKEIIKIKVPYY